MKLYTKTGDGGMTGMIGGRVRKDDARVEACGTIDELNSLVGLAIQSAALDERYADLAGRLTVIQHELFDCGSDLSYVNPGDRPYKVTPEMVEALEADIDRLHAEAPPIRRFILPGGTPLAAWLHACRTVCRRAERRTVSLAGATEANREVLRYLNRLSDYFFAAARAANARAGVPDTEYVRGADVFRLEDRS
jgi:cob(I)alamin adenosyltransferase